MGDWQMRGAYEGKMDGMPMGDMKGMENMPGMQKTTGAGTRQVAGLSLTLNTAPENPKAGDVLLELTLTEQAGKPVTNARVLFVYTMPMPGMTDSKVTARHTTDGLYEGKVMFGMGGTWVVTVNVTVPGRPPFNGMSSQLAAGVCNREKQASRRPWAGKNGLPSRPGAGG